MVANFEVEYSALVLSLIVINSLDDEPEEDEKESRDEIEESIEQEIQDALNGKESDKSSDDEMEKLRLEALSKFIPF